MLTTKKYITIDPDSAIDPKVYVEMRRCAYGGAMRQDAARQFPPRRGRNEIIFDKHECRLLNPITPHLMKIAFTEHFLFDMLHAEYGDRLYERCPDYVKENGADPADPETYFDIPFVVTAKEDPAACLDELLPFYRAEALRGLLRMEGGAVFGDMGWEFFDIPDVTFSRAASLSCCAYCGFDYDMFLNTFKPA